ncbi:MAG: pantetheine-phosphate adenylyltransferase [Chloroflexota bacterium]|nr:pantetheine-phosphate adenylyltransferase [Chloroflexota bacterium]
MSALSGGRVAVYPGTFDPFHKGHLDIALRAARLFDEVVVAVYDRPAKKLLFSTRERVELIRASLADVDGRRIVVDEYSELSVQYARARGALAMVRGLRTELDFAYEYQLTAMNRHMAPEVETVFLVTDPTLAHISSTLIKEVAAGGARIEALVPTPVAEALLRRLERTP